MCGSDLLCVKYKYSVSYEILMFVCNLPAKSHEILRFVRLQKDSKQCCDATKLNRTHCNSQFTPKMKANAESRLLSSLV